MQAFFDIINKVFDMAATFGPHEWGAISVVTIVVGYMCLRGMSIR